MLVKVLAVLFLLVASVAASNGGVTTQILGWIAGPLIGGLIVYFFSTRNLEANVKKHAKREAEEQVNIHNLIEHKESPWDVVAKHKQECGEKLDDKLEKLEDGLHKIDKKHERTNTSLRSISLTVHAIAKKMNIISTPQVMLDPDDTGG